MGFIVSLPKAVQTVYSIYNEIWNKYNSVFAIKLSDDFG